MYSNAQHREENVINQSNVGILFVFNIEVKII